MTQDTGPTHDSLSGGADPQPGDVRQDEDGMRYVFRDDKWWPAPELDGDDAAEKIARLAAERAEAHRREVAALMKEEQEDMSDTEKQAGPGEHKRVAKGISINNRTPGISATRATNRNIHQWVEATSKPRSQGARVGGRTPARGRRNF